MGAVLGCEKEDCCSKYKGKSCPKGGGTGKDDYCSEKFPCPTECGKGSFRAGPTKNCEEYKPGCKINQYKVNREAAQCYDVETRKPVEGFGNHRQGNSNGESMCPYKILQFTVLILFIYLLSRLIKSCK